MFHLFGPVDPSVVSELAKFGSSLDPPILILGDFNAHNPLWFGISTNQRGRVIERLLVENNISVLGDESPIYFNVVHNSTSVIDLTLLLELVYGFCLDCFCGTFQQ